MAVVKTVLKNTNQEAVVKVAGTPATTPSATIDLSTDLVATTQTASGTQRVNIAGVTWTGTQGAEWSIARNSVVIMTLQADTNGHLDFSGQDMISDTIGNDEDIVVTVSGGQAEVWLRLKKVDGYATKIEPEQYGAHDDESAVGS